MNVYDFDKTIYNGDSTEDFIIMCLKRRPALILRLLRCGITFAGYKAGLCSKTEFKEVMYRFLRDIDDIDDWVEEFWDSHLYRIKGFYIRRQREDDVIISASPEFLLREVCDRIGIKHLIASRVDRHTGCYLGLNCCGEEKVRRFREEFGDAEIDKFYSDSLIDAPLAKLAKSAYMVKGEEITDWPNK